MDRSGGSSYLSINRLFNNRKACKRLTVAFILAIFFLAQAATGAAESPEAAPDLMEESWRQFFNRDYILSLEVAEGYLWQGMNGGLMVRNLQTPEISRFYHSQNVQLPVNQVHDLAAGEADGLWMAGDQGAVYRDARGQFQHYHPGNSPLPEDAVRSVAVAETGGAWFATWGGGAYYLDEEERWVTYNSQNSDLPGNHLYRVRPDPDGGAWFATDGQGAAYVSPDGDWQVYTTRNSELPANDVLDIAIGTDGTVWFATSRGLAGLADKQDWLGSPEEGGENDELFQSPLTFVQCLEVGADGALWAGTRDGLIHVDGQRKARVFSPGNSELPDAQITSLFLDERGGVWIGTLGEGLVLFDPAMDSWKVYRDEPLDWADVPYLPSNRVNYVKNIAEIDGSPETWICLDNGLSVYSKDTGCWRRPAAPAEFEEYGVNRAAYHPEGGAAYAVFGEGVFWKNIQGRWEHFTTENSALPSNNIVDLSFDQAGGLWMATQDAGAAYRTLEGLWRTYQSDDGLPSDNINAVSVSPHGEIWLATWDSGVAVLDLAGPGIEFRSLDTASTPLPSNDVSDVFFAEDNSVWLATWGGGLARITGEGAWNVYDMTDAALPSNEIRDLTQDKRGWIWAATPAGAASFDGMTWRHYSTFDSGLASNDIQSISTDVQGNIWFATSSSGLAVHNPGGLSEALLQMAHPGEQLEEILLVCQDRCLDDEGLSVIKSGRTLVPVRVIAEATGARVDWDNEKGTATITSKDRTLELRPDEKQVYVNGETSELDVPAKLTGGRILVPLRFVVEALGLEVTWDEFLRAIYIKG